MGVAYLITAYKGPVQLGRLVRRIELESDARVVVHVDDSVDVRPFREACTGTRAELLERRQRVTYAAFSSVRAKMLLAEAALDDELTHAVLLSEQDYPIKPLADLEAQLARHPDEDFIEVRPVESELPTFVHRYRRFHFPDWPDWAPKWRTADALSVVRRRLPRELAPYGGSAWWALTRASLEHVVDTYRTDRQLRRFFANTRSPDELYVHTVLGNSSPRARQPSVTYVRFDPSISRQHPVVWTIDDVDELEAADGYLARKFDLGVDSEVLDHFDRRTVGRRSPTPVD